MTIQPQPTWRKPAGMGILLLLIALLAWGVTTAMEHIGPMPLWAQLCTYAIAGIVWIAPLRPLLLWMETGKWRE